MQVQVQQCRLYRGPLQPQQGKQGQGQAVQGQVYLQAVAQAVVLLGLVQAVQGVGWPVCAPSHLTALCWTLQLLQLRWGRRLCQPC
jgi:hypothetical protein